MRLDLAAPDELPEGDMSDRRFLLAALSIAAAGIGSFSPVGAALAAAAPRGAEVPPLIQGVVFADRNGDGVREAGEPGLPGVEVSNGRDIVLTGGDGGYRIPPGDTGMVFVIKPRGWRSPQDRLHLPQFYARVAVASSDPGPAPADAPAGHDFGLVPNPETDDLTALVLTDPQPSSPREVDYLARGLVDEMGGRTDAAFGVTLGDVVYDRPELFRPVSEVLARVGVPWYNLPGNHDLGLAPGDDRKASAAFESAYGPSTYAFHWGPALFVALDDVRPLGGPRFIGGLTPSQFAFIEALLRRAPPEEWVVLMLHIPLAPPDPSTPDAFRPADRARLFALLRNRPRVLVLSGHTHGQRHFFYGPEQGWSGALPLHEYNVAAACGGFWGGPPDEHGVPVATMGDGTPPGYGRLSFRRGTVACEYQPARFPSGHQIGLTAPRAVAAGAGYVSFYANVFNGHAGWTVEARVDDRRWTPMRLQLGWDPGFAAAFLAQNTVDQPPAGPRLPDPAICYHLWRAYLPADLAPGAHVLAVRAADPAGGSYQSAQTFRVAAR